MIPAAEIAPKLFQHQPTRMYLTCYIISFVFLNFSQLCSSLQHEKSFMVPEGSAPVWRFDFYGDSLLQTSSNDIVQRSIENGLIRRVFRAHTNQIWSFTVMKDSKLVTAGWDDMVVVWDLQTGAILHRIWLGASETLVNAVSFHNDLVFTGGKDTKLRQINSLTGRIMRTTYTFQEISSIVSDGIFLYLATTSSPFPIIKYRIISISVEQDFMGHPSPVFALHISNSLLFSASGDASIFCWNTFNGLLLRSFVGHRLAIFALTTVGDELYSGGQDVFIIKWKVTTGEIAQVLPMYHSNAVRWLAEKDGSLFSGSDDTNIIQWNVTQDSPAFFYLGQKITLRAVALWKNYVLSGGDNTNIDVWDTSFESIQPFVTLRGHFNSVNCLKVHEDFLFSGSSDENIVQWNLTAFTMFRTLSGHLKSVLSFAADDFYLYSGSRDTTIKRWNISSGVLSNEYIGNTDEIQTLALDNDLMYSGCADFSVKVWSKESYTTIRTINALASVNALILLDEFLVVGLDDGLRKFSFEGDLVAEYLADYVCSCLEYRFSSLFSGHSDSIIRLVDLNTLFPVQSLMGHQSYVLDIKLGETGSLYSASFDGAVKKWNLATRRVAFSFENRNGSVTSLAGIGEALILGSLSGRMNFFEMNSAQVWYSNIYHDGPISSLVASGDFIFSCGKDGKILMHDYFVFDEPLKILESSGLPLKSLVVTMNSLFSVAGDSGILRLPRNASTGESKIYNVASPLLCIAVSGHLILAGSRTGAIKIFNFKDDELAPFIDLKRHTSQVNNLLVSDDFFYSASDDKTIIQWSMNDMTVVRVLERSASGLGHLGPVNSLTLCNRILFSGGADNTVRRWNAGTGKHEDVYFGPTKAVSSVLCYNLTVFAGSDDFSVLMYRPDIPPLGQSSQLPSQTQRPSFRRQTKAFRAYKNGLNYNSISRFEIIVLPIVAVFLVLLSFSAYRFYLLKTYKSGPHISKETEAETSTTTASVTDLQTVINSVMGLSKHAAFIIESSALAQEKKIAAGGGGELFLAKVMDPRLKKNVGPVVVQKILFSKTATIEQSFYQEVGIMIMLSQFPHFCKIVGFTENPLSIVMKNYPDGSLHSWMHQNNQSKKITSIILRDIAEALKTMHSHYLAHCDIKPQNVLVEMNGNTPSCVLTDFGITQILSDSIIAAKSFNVLPLRGLSIAYASPEAFSNFRTKKYSRVDFKRYDVYSYACVILEVMSRRAPWS